MGLFANNIKSLNFIFILKRYLIIAITKNKLTNYGRKYTSKWSIMS